MPSTEHVPGIVLVLGIDAFRGGWVGVLHGGRFLAADGDRSFEKLVARHPQAEVIGVDMPIGLATDGPRQCDAEARGIVGKRRSSVFLTPPRTVLEAPTHQTATAMSVALTGTGISRQAFGLRDRIFEVEAVADGDARVIEVHPEVSFRALAGAEVGFSKHTWNGHMERHALLAAAGIVIPRAMLSGLAGSAGVDDVLDAAVAAWSAARYAAGRAKSLPEGAQPGDRPAIWY